MSYLVPKNDQKMTHWFDFIEWLFFGKKYNNKRTVFDQKITN